MSPHKGPTNGEFGLHIGTGVARENLAWPTLDQEPLGPERPGSTSLPLSSTQREELLTHNFVPHDASTEVEEGVFLITRVKGMLRSTDKLLEVIRGALAAHRETLTDRASFVENFFGSRIQAIGGENDPQNTLHYLQTLSTNPSLNQPAPKPEITIQTVMTGIAILGSCYRDRADILTSSLAEKRAQISTDLAALDQKIVARDCLMIDRAYARTHRRELIEELVKNKAQSGPKEDTDYHLGALAEPRVYETQEPEASTAQTADLEQSRLLASHDQGDSIGLANLTNPIDNALINIQNIDAAIARLQVEMNVLQGRIDEETSTIPGLEIELQTLEKMQKYDQNLRLELLRTLIDKLLSDQKLIRNFEGTQEVDSAGSALQPYADMEEITRVLEGLFSEIVGELRTGKFPIDLSSAEKNTDTAGHDMIVPKRIHQTTSPINNELNYDIETLCCGQDSFQALYLKNKSAIETSGLRDEARMGTDILNIVLLQKAGIKLITELRRIVTDIDALDQLADSMARRHGELETRLDAASGSIANHIKKQVYYDNGIVAIHQKLQVARAQLEKARIDAQNSSARLRSTIALLAEQPQDGDTLNAILQGLEPAGGMAENISTPESDYLEEMMGVVRAEEEALKTVIQRSSQTDQAKIQAQESLKRTEAALSKLKETFESNTTDRNTRIAELGLAALNLQTLLSELSNVMEEYPETSPDEVPVQTRPNDQPLTSSLPVGDSSPKDSTSQANEDTPTGLALALGEALAQQTLSPLHIFTRATRTKAAKGRA